MKTIERPLDKDTTLHVLAKLRGGWRLRYKDQPFGDVLERNEQYEMIQDGTIAQLLDRGFIKHCGHGRYAITGQGEFYLSEQFKSVPSLDELFGRKKVNWFAIVFAAVVAALVAWLVWGWV